MPDTFQHIFSDVPLIITADEFNAGHIEVTVDLTYWHDGQWAINEVYLDGYRRKPAGAALAAIAKGRPVNDEMLVPLDGALRSIVLDRLHNEHRKYVQDAVNDQIEQDRDNFECNRADYILAHRRG